jgi:protein-disulfide isomerase
MKKTSSKKGWLVLTAFMLMMVLSVWILPVQAAVEEGTDYVVLAKPIPGMDKTVMKVFSYDCPFCYKYDKAVTPAVAGTLAKDGIKFTVWHLKTKGKYGVQGSELFASLITKDQKAGLGLFDDKSSFKKAKMAYYKAYHDKRERWDGGVNPFMKTGLDAAGITSAEFQKLLQDPATKARLKDWEGAIDVAKIQGVPAFVVKGKYLLYTKSIKSIDDMAGKIKELMAK